MSANYLQHIQSVYSKQPGLGDYRFLVSGVDTLVRQVVGRQIVSSCYAKQKVLLILDNTYGETDFRSDLGGYRVVDLLDDGINLCGDFFEVESLTQISRLRSLLSSLGFDGIKAMKVVNYLSFIKETERRLGKTGPLSAKTLEEYGGTMLVKWHLDQLLQNGSLSQANYEYLLGRYSEVSSSAADFDSFLILFAPFLGSVAPHFDMAVHLPVGKFSSDPSMQLMLCHLIAVYASEHPDTSAVLILDNGRGERAHITEMIRTLPAGVESHMLTDDAFSFDVPQLNVIMNSFPVRVYTRHENMSSCEKIEQHCGQMDVVKRSSSVAIDRRIWANSGWDMLFGTNRTDVSVKSVPTKESRFRKEFIHALRPRTGIVDCGGSQVLFSF